MVVPTRIRDWTMDVTVKYFKKGGDHSDEVLKHAKEIIDSNGDIKDIIVASTRGGTGLLACKIFDPGKYNVIVVTHSDGFAGPNKQELKTGNKEQIERLGGKVLTATHALSGVESGISKVLSGGVVFPVELFAKILRIIACDGVKVCIEIALMAADAGFITDVTKDVLCIGGTGAGADTACIIKPAYSRAFTELRLKQILCKPEIGRS
ncbi:hypothetical protein GF325_01525 [Candidatus Bathyarchaeota archaeon]|nr:hypothetical protein [Candidatus Bathyarchaeota archaeon]